MWRFCKVDLLVLDPPRPFLIPGFWSTVFLIFQLIQWPSCFDHIILILDKSLEDYNVELKYTSRLSGA